MANNTNEMTQEQFVAQFPTLVEAADRIMSAQTAEELREAHENFHNASKALSPEQQRILDEM
ncbi:MAG TPA: hypothetical protein VGN34_26865 [Ktedonobacteraceae bacterium]|jgi:hypothetical protein